MARTKLHPNQFNDSTRFVSGNGVSINGADNTKFDIQAIGEIVDPNTFLTTQINVNLTAQTVTYIAAQVESYVWINSSGSLVQSLTPPDPMLFDTIIGYWVLVHSNLTNLNVINSFPLYGDGVFIKLAQTLSYLGFNKFPGTNIVSAGTTATRISHSGGNAIKLGLGNTTKRPVATLSGATDDTFEMRHRNGTYLTGQTNLDVTNYNPSGSTVSALTNNKYTACKVWKFASSLIRIQYGQYEYANFSEALAKFDHDTYVDEGNASRNGMHIGWIIFKKGTDWTTGVVGSDYQFIDVTNGKSSSSLTPTLQSSYEISLPSAEITTNSTNGALSLKRGSTADTDSVIEIKNGSATVTKSINGNGLISKRVTTVTSSATPTLNTDITDIARLTGLATNITNASTNLTGTPNHGDMFCYEITDNGVARTITWGTSFSNTGTLSLPTTTVISTLLRVLFQWNSATSKWEVVAVV